MKQRRNNYFYKHDGSKSKRKKDKSSNLSQVSSFASKVYKSHRSKTGIYTKENVYNLKQKTKDYSPFRSKKTPIEKIAQKLQNLAKKKIKKYQKSTKVSTRKHSISQNYFKLVSSRTNKLNKADILQKR